MGIGSWVKKKKITKKEAKEFMDNLHLMMVLLVISGFLMGIGIFGLFNCMS